MTISKLLRGLSSVIVSASVVACGGEKEVEAQAAAPAASAPPPAASAGVADNPCPLTIEQVAAVTGAPMTRPPGGCTFFPANGRDIPHVFYVLQIPMVCTSIQPSELGFMEPVAGLPARAAYVKDALDGSHLLVCPNDNARAFDIVVEIRNDDAQNREVATALARQVLAGR